MSAFEGKAVVTQTDFHVCLRHKADSAYCYLPICYCFNYKSYRLRLGGQKLAPARFHWPKADMPIAPLPCPLSRVKRTWDRRGRGSNRLAQNIDRSGCQDQQYHADECYHRLCPADDLAVVINSSLSSMTQSSCAARHY